MSKLVKKLNEISARRAARPALMTHVVLGYPSMKESIELVCAMADEGVSIVELQIPFSDPMADGPTIMMANEHALARGTTPADCMRAMEKLSAKVDIPLLFMSYYQIPFCYRGGGAGFCRDAKNAGAEGLIVPDVPPEENADGYWEALKKYQLASVPVVTPLTPSKRIEMLSKTAAKSFVYCVSVAGTTGARKSLPKDVKSYLARVKKHCTQPLALGFGISTPSQVRSIGRTAEIAIVGSATINVMEAAKKGQEVQAARRFIRTLVS